MRLLPTMLSAAILTGSACAAPLDLQPYVGRPYATLHARLASAGYGPFRPLQPGSPAYRMDIYGRGDVYDRYKEVQACAGTGLGDCEFVLRRGDDVIVLHTTGETVATLVVADYRHETARQAEQLYRLDRR